MLGVAARAADAVDVLLDGDGPRHSRGPLVGTRSADWISSPIHEASRTQLEDRGPLNIPSRLSLYPKLQLQCGKDSLAFLGEDLVLQWTTAAISRSKSRRRFEAAPEGAQAPSSCLCGLEDVFVRSRVLGLCD